MPSAEPSRKMTLPLPLAEKLLIDSVHMLKRRNEAHALCKCAQEECNTLSTSWAAILTISQLRCLFEGSPMKRVISVTSRL